MMNLVDSDSDLLQTSLRVLLITFFHFTVQFIT